MKQSETWPARACAAWLILIAASACESLTEVGSTCQDGVCTQPLSTTPGPACLLTETSMEIQVTGGGLTGVCLPRPLPLDADGLADCRVDFTFDPDSNAEATAAGPCRGLPYLEEDGAEPGRCAVRQIGAAELAAGEDGWFYDTVIGAEDCSGGPSLRWTEAASPDNALIELTCRTALALGDDDETAVTAASQCAQPGGSASDVGAACLPRVIPEGGFSDLEVNLEVGSTMCQTGACLVYHLHGEPVTGCVPSISTDCATEEELERSAYCSCRCSGPEDAALPPLCDCKDGFSCVDIGSVDAEPNGYCVRNGTFVSE